MDLLPVMRGAVRHAAAEALALLGSPAARRVIGRGSGGDLTQGIDDAVETSITRFLEAEIGDCAIVSEERGWITVGRGGPPFFILDPLDGTTNALRGYPCFSISLAASMGLRLREITAGVVLDVAHDNLYWARRGGGAFLNGVKVKPSQTETVEDALIAIDLNLRRALPSYLAKVSPIIDRAEHVRFLGTDALETCFVASGACDAFVDLRGTLRLTDLAAATFIVQEAGGTVVDARGAQLDMAVAPESRGSFIAACTKGLCDRLLELTRRS
ncbi:MAG: inositol monophosphatase family protein [Candidatus Bathyarchaeia archaeon]